MQPCREGRLWGWEGLVRILVVDDQVGERKALKAILETEGYDIAEACNGAEAISLMAANLPDLIVTDIFMPIIDGFMLCREVRRNPKYRHIPVLFHTATFTSRDDERLAIDVGGSAYLRKPAAAEILLPEVLRLTTLNGDEASPAMDVSTDLDRKYAEALLRKLTQKSSALEEMRRVLETKRDWPSLLKGIRGARGLKQAALAQLLGIDQSRVSRWESGREVPSIGTQKTILDLMEK